MRRRGGGHKRKYRVIDFKRNKFGVVGDGEGDRVRSEPLGAHRARRVRGRREALHPAPEGALGGRHDRLRARARTSGSGNAMPLKEMPLGTAVHNVELKIGKGGQMAARPAWRRRSSRRKASTSRCACRRRKCAWCTARCLATIGVVGNEEHELLSWGKAGKTRWKGRRPKVRGEVMNPVDHPHGGRTRGGRNVVSPWGKKEGVKTRNKKKSSQRLHRPRPEARQSDAVTVNTSDTRIQTHGT